MPESNSSHPIHHSPQSGQCFNFSMKLMRGGHLICENVLRIPVENITGLKLSQGEKLAGYLNDSPEEQASQIMFCIERAINVASNYRCHIEQLPSDVPAGVRLEA